MAKDETSDPDESEGRGQAPELAGGAGFTFADHVASHYLSSLLAEAEAKGVVGFQVVRVALEQRNHGEPLDDLIIDASEAGGQPMRLSLQVKSSLTISAAKSNADFREIVRDCWLTLDKPDFRDGLDRLGAAVREVRSSKDVQVNRLCELARSSATADDLARRFDDNAISQPLLAVLEIFKTLTAELGRPVGWPQLHRFLSHFLILRFDYGGEASGDSAATTALLNSTLQADHEAGEPSKLLNELRLLARDGAGRSATFNRPHLLRKLRKFPLATTPSHASSLAALDIASTSALKSIVNVIGSTHLQRPKLAELVAQRAAQHRFVLLTGLPGSGKSALLRQVAENFDTQTKLFLKSDRLPGASWSAFAADIGLRTGSIPTLLTELAIVGEPIIFIDGLDRIPETNRGIVIDLVNEILGNDGLGDWKIIATLRDSGVEPLRNWLPASLIEGQDTSTINIPNLSDEEAADLAKQQPMLREILFGTEPVREIVRRPFFAKIIAQSGFAASPAPKAEVELAARWWDKGGFNAEATRAVLRQRAMLHLARLRAATSERPIPLLDVPTDLLEPVQELIEDGILQRGPDSHGVSFAHDIFFEWAFFQRLRAEGINWVKVVADAGEPPTIVRSIELLSQANFVEDAEWQATLDQLAESDLRQQWTRAWLLGPVSLPGFSEHSGRYAQTLFANDSKYLRKALVWFQASRTRPNPDVLSGRFELAEMPKDELIRLADLVGWPSDMLSWARFLWLLDSCMAAVPARLIPDVVTLFEVWQNALRHTPNPVSKMIGEHDVSWLQSLDKRSKRQSAWSREKQPEPDFWDDLGSDPAKLASSVRLQLFWMARPEYQRVRDYLRQAVEEPDITRAAFSDAVVLSGLLAETHAHLLSKLTFSKLAKELPKDFRDRRRRERLEAQRKHGRDPAFVTLGYADDFSGFHWRDLAIDGEPGYFPASPLRQPFASLFQHNPVEARKLLKRLSNHATKAWRQVKELNREEPRQPIPVEVKFPWGAQLFWGSGHQYFWYRGSWAAAALGSAYLAFDRWALAQLEEGADPDRLIEQVIRGNNSVAALGLALSIALKAGHKSAAAEALLTCQRIWGFELARFSQDFQEPTAALIGFNPSDGAHVKVIRELAAQPHRRIDFRSAVIQLIFQADRQSSERVRQTILNFANEPPFEFEDQRQGPAREAYEELAQRNAKFGQLENYVAVQSEENEATAIYFDNPEAKNEDVQRQLAEGREYLTASSIWTMADRCFEQSTGPDQEQLDNAVDFSQRVFDVATFSEPTAEQGEMKRAAIAATAALIHVFDRAGEQRMAWARTVLDAVGGLEEEGHHLEMVSVIPWHPAIFAAHAWAANVRADPEDMLSAAKLLTVIAHRRENVSLAGTKIALRLADASIKTAWVALCLALALKEWPMEAPTATGDPEPDADRKHRQQKLDDFVECLERDGWPSLPLPHASWTKVDEGQEQADEATAEERDEFDEFDLVEDLVVDGWKRAPWAFDSKGAGEVLKLVELGHFWSEQKLHAQFQDYANAMMQWSIDAAIPPWSRNDRKKAEPGNFEWTHHFAGFLGNLAGYLPLEAVKAAYLDAILALSEDLSLSFLHPLMNLFVCAHVMDAQHLNANAQQLHQLALERLESIHALRRTSHRAGQLTGFDAPQLAETLFLVAVEYAPLAHRFANRDWNDLGVFLPAIERFASANAWSRSIADDWLTLCERAKDQVPAEIFANVQLAVAEAYPDGPPNWRDTLLPARIAGQIQEHSERPDATASVKQSLLRILDWLVDLGDRRSAALQLSPQFRELRIH